MPKQIGKQTPLDQNDQNIINIKYYKMAIVMAFPNRYGIPNLLVASFLNTIFLGPDPAGPVVLRRALALALYGGRRSRQCAFTPLVKSGCIAAQKKPLLSNTFWAILSNSTQSYSNFNSNLLNII